MGASLMHSQKEPDNDVSADCTSPSKLEELEAKLKRAQDECAYWHKRFEHATASIADDITNETLILRNIRSRLSMILRDMRNIRTHHSSNENTSAEMMLSLDPASLHREAMVRDIDGVVCDLENEILSLRITNQPSEQSETGHGMIADRRISLSSFNVNDIALFFPTPRGDYLAFHIDCPHHYLSEESKALIGTVR